MVNHKAGKAAYLSDTIASRVGMGQGAEEREVYGRHTAESTLQRSGEGLYMTGLAPTRVTRHTHFQNGRDLVVTIRTRTAQLPQRLGTP